MISEREMEPGWRPTPYMGGRGIAAETQRLVDATWARIPAGVIGFTMVAVGLLFGFASIYDRESYSTTAILAGVAFAGWLIARPWIVAQRRLSLHTARVEAETRVRGPGWADS